MNYKIECFDMKHIPLLVDEVEPLWSPSLGDRPFKRFNVEYIIRNNIFDNDLRFQLTEDEAFCAAAFFARKGDVCSASEWFKEKSVLFPSDFLVASDMSRTYLELMDKKTFVLMNDDDIKLSLYISRKKGYGSRLLDAVCTQLKDSGYKNLFLWTDVECNWEWYVHHGYTLLNEDIYQPFSSEGYGYKTFIFQKAL